MAERAGYDQVRPQRLRSRLQLVSNGAAWHVLDPDGVDGCAVSLEMFDHLLAPRTFVASHEAGRIDHDNRDPVGAFDQRQRVVERSRSWPA
jgi:hypothetical protein